MCPNAGNADEQTHHWQSIFAPSIVDRINQAAPGANLMDVDIPYLMMLCPFETVAKETRSQFCDLFTQDEFEAFEYYGDLNKFYGFGYVFIFLTFASVDNHIADTDKRLDGSRV